MGKGGGYIAMACGGHQMEGGGVRASVHATGKALERTLILRPL